MHFFQSARPWTWPLIAWLIFTPFSAWIDHSVTQFVYENGNDPVEHFFNTSLLNFIYDWGPLPAHLTAIFAAIVLLLSYLIPSFKAFRKWSMVLVLTYAMGAGLLVNGVFKEYWGRPRPKQVEEFGGNQPFRPYYSPNFFPKVPAKSFPCGHCAMGFYFFVLIVIGARLKSKKWIDIGLLLGLFLGIALSLTRILQGGHFISDTLFAALLMWYTALIMDWLVYQGEPFP